MSLSYKTIAELVQAAEDAGKTISEVVLADQAEQMEMEAEVLFERMHASYQVMCDAIEKGSDPNIRSTSGLTGGDAAKMRAACENGTTVAGSVYTGALWRALAVSEQNAAMGRIVAAPTAGSCGILPGALVTMQDDLGKSEDACVRALFTASAIGMVIANCATLAGASGGCQAECGAASAMAAAAIVELNGGTPAMCGHAVAIAIKNILGLVCDPVAGLVEIPCIKRNAGGVSTALMAAELALAGITSHIPADETILSLKRVGDGMPCSLRETADGGLAITPTGLRLRMQVFGE